jgi:GH25 family lysozyme M1 (1,4-beta-N-acetylmuramidase)
MLNYPWCKNEGIEFVIIKATDGSGFTDPEFTANLNAVRNAGLIPAAYHYVRGSVSAVSQVSRIISTVPLSVPVILDVEAGSGGVSLVREIIDRLRAVGYRVPLLYLPRWYWQQLGSPSLVGLPPLWSSRYPDNTVGSIQDEWADVPAHYWNGYGGLSVAILQFSSSGRVAGYSPLDLNAYQGTRAGLLALLYGQQPTPAPIELAMEDDEMAKYCLIKGNNQNSMPPPHQGSKYGDAVFLLESTVEGLIRRHVSADEYHALVSSGMKVSEHPQAWVDSISLPLGLFPWETTEEETT